MLNLDSVSAFMAIANTGSFSDAARQLALAKSVVSERLKDLERSLGAKLVHRTTRRVALTADGATFYERAKRILHEAELAASELAHRRGTADAARPRSNRLTSCRLNVELGHWRRIRS